MLRCSMYDTLPAFVEGWRRIFIDACKRKPSRLRKHGVRLLLVGVLFPTIQLVALIVPIVAMANQLVLPGVLLAVVGLDGLESVDSQQRVIQVQDAVCAARSQG